MTTSAPAQLIPGAGVTLYRLAASGWQVGATTMTGSDGRFRLRLSGPPDPTWFLLLVQDPNRDVDAAASDQCLPPGDAQAVTPFCHRPASPCGVSGGAAFLHEGVLA